VLIKPVFPSAEQLGKAFDDLPISDLPAPVAADGSYYVSAPDSGAYFGLSPQKTVRAIVLHSEGADGFSAFQGAMASGFSFALGRDEVRALFGSPDKMAEAGGTGIFATPNALDTYFTGTTYTTFTYEPDLASTKTVSLGINEG
jgi:hypothetical protein